MTQTHSLNKSPRVYDLLCSYKKNWLLPFVSLLMFNILGYGVSLFNSISKAIEDSQNADAFIKGTEYIFFKVTPWPAFISIGLFAISLLSAVSAFSFITSKKQSNVYLSFGLNRNTLFANRCFACITMLMASFLIPLTAGVFINIHFFGYSSAMLMVYLLSIVGYSAFVLVGFGIGAFAMALTGNVREGLVCAAGTSILPALIVSNVAFFFREFLYGNPYYGSSGLVGGLLHSTLERFFIGTPTFFFTSLSDASNTSQTSASIFARSGSDVEKILSPGIDFFLPVIIWLVIGTGILGFAKFLFKKKKAENIGSLGSSTVSNHIIAVSAFCFGIKFISQFHFDTSRGKILFIILGGIVFISICYMAVQGILLRNGKKFVKSLTILPVYLVLFSASILVFSTGGLGYSNRVPKVADIEKAYISMPYKMPFYDVHKSNLYMGSGSINITQKMSMSYVGPFESQADMEKLVEIHSQLTEIDDSTDAPTICIEYILKDGSTITRGFSSTTEKARTSLFSLCEGDFGESYIKKLFTEKYVPPKVDESNTNKEESYGNNNVDIIDNSPKSNSEKIAFYLEDGIAKMKRAMDYEAGMANLTSNDGSVSMQLNGELSPEEFIEMKRLVAEDLCNMSYEKRYLNKSVPKAIMTFQDNSTGTAVDVMTAFSPVGNDAYGYNVSGLDSVNSIPIYPEMEKTIAFLNDKGLLNQVASHAKLIGASVVKNDAELLRKSANNNGDGYMGAERTRYSLYLEPFATIMLKTDSKQNKLSDIISFKADESNYSYQDVMRREKLESYQFMFKDGQIISDTAQLEELYSASLPTAYANTKGYYVLFEFETFYYVFFVSEENAPAFIAK